MRSSLRRLEDLLGCAAFIFVILCALALALVWSLFAVVWNWRKR